ncbi:MAG TPA: hypothetical protein VFV34_18705, partial [Blastocatellia bacterium]|nr:hypothetical protein [Blastocatellia bacterium]
MRRNRLMSVRCLLLLLCAAVVGSTAAGQYPQQQQNQQPQYPQSPQGPQSQGERPKGGPGQMSDGER